MMPQTMNSYAYSLNNPVNMSDPSGRFLIPAWIIAMWAIAEIGLTASDANDFANTMQDPNANLCDKAFSGALFAAGVIGPGGGYGKAAKGIKAVDKAIDAAKQFNKLSEGEIKKLQQAGENIEELKGGKSASQYDLFKDPKTGEIYVKPKSGAGPGEPTGLNIKDY